MNLLRFVPCVRCETLRWTTAPYTHRRRPQSVHASARAFAFDRDRRPESPGGALTRLGLLFEQHSQLDAFSTATPPNRLENRDVAQITAWGSMTYAEG